MVSLVSICSTICRRNCFGEYSWESVCARRWNNPSWGTRTCLSLYIRPEKWHFAGDIRKCIFFNENVYILIKISLQLVPMVPTDKESALIRVMAWCPMGASHSLSEAIVSSESSSQTTRFIFLFSGSVYVMLGLHRTPKGPGTDLRPKMAKLKVTHELVGKAYARA